MLVDAYNDDNFRPRLRFKFHQGASPAQVVQLNHRPLLWLLRMGNWICLGDSNVRFNLASDAFAAEGRSKVGW